MSTVRPAAVAGLFYPAEAQALRATVDQLLARPLAAEALVTLPPKALIVPHAGYVYSGPTAARAYATLYPWADRIRRVVMLGPVHRVPVRGLALPGVDAFDTPLGRVDLDAEVCHALRSLPQVVVAPAAHAAEHALEVQLPFLQTVLDRFTLVPLAVGDATPEQVAQVLESAWGGDETLIVVSSDLSHYLPYADAQRRDHDTVERILSLTGPLSHQQACGGTPINGLLPVAQRHGLRPVLLDLCNSGDTAGDRQRVVGYAALVFVPEHPFSPAEQVQHVLH